MNLQLKTDDVDLSGGRAPEKFYVSITPNRYHVEDWRNSPAALDHTLPSSNWCALANIRMVLLAKGRYAPDMEYLWKRACEADVYRLKTPEEEKDGGPGWRGAFHAELAEFMRSEFELDAWTTTLGTDDGDIIEGMKAELRAKRFVIASVSPAIRYPEHDEPPAKAGHFVLLYGLRTNASGVSHFIVHNSAGFQSLNSQISVRVHEDRMRQVASGRVVIVDSR